MEPKYAFAVRLADLSVKISCRYEYTVKMCEKYTVPDSGVYDIESSATEAEIETEISLVPGVRPEHAEFLCVYRNIARRLPGFSRAVFHGAAISYKDKGYIFTAPSGTGKSTHIKLWRRMIGDQVKIVNGDKPIVAAQGGAVTVYGTPWAGKENWQRNTGAAVGAVCVLCRGEKNSIEPVKPEDCISEFMHQIYLPDTPDALSNTLGVLGEIIKSVPVYRLYCDISEQAVKTSFEALTGEKYPEKK